MGVEAIDVVRTAVVRLDDSRELWFHTYTLGKRRLGGARVYESNEKYWGPTKSGFDMNLEQLRQIVPMLAGLSRDVENGLVVPPLEHGRVSAGRTADWVIQVLEGGTNSETLLLDVRKFVASERFTGFTRKGLRLDFEWIDAIVEHLPGVCESLEAWSEGRWGLFAQEQAGESETSCQAPDSVPDEYRDFF